MDKLVYTAATGLKAHMAAQAAIANNMDPELSHYLDSGRLHEFLAKDTETSRAILAVVDKLAEMYKEKLAQQEQPKEEKPRRISLLKLPGEEEEE